MKQDKGLAVYGHLGHSYFSSEKLTLANCQEFFLPLHFY